MRIDFQIIPLNWIKIYKTLEITGFIKVLAHNQDKQELIIYLNELRVTIILMTFFEIL